MMGFGPETWMAMVAVAMIAGVIKGVVGFAMPTIMISGLGIFLAPDLALAFLILPTFVANVPQALRNGIGPAVRSGAIHWRFIAILLVFMAISAQLVTVMSASAMFLALGVPITAFAVAQLLGWRLKIRDGTQRRVEMILGSIAGFIGGISGAWGPPTVAYLTALNTPKVEAVRIQGLVFGIGAVVLVVAHIQTGILSAATAPISAALIVPALIGTFIGFKIQDRMDQEKFRTATLVVLILAGLNLVRRGLFL